MTVITKIEDLQEILKNRSWLFPGTDSIQLELEGLTEEQKLSYQTKLNRLVNECGCHSGSVTSVVSLIVFALLIILLSSSFSVWHIVIAVVVVFAAGAAGKIYGLIRAKSKLNSVITNLYLQIKPNSNF